MKLACEVFCRQQYNIQGWTYAISDHSADLEIALSYLYFCVADNCTFVNTPISETNI